MWRTAGRSRQRVEDVHRLLARDGEDVLAALGGEAVDEEVGGDTFLGLGLRHRHGNASLAVYGPGVAGV